MVKRKGRGIRPSFKSSGWGEKPKFCVKAVMLTALQRLTPEELAWKLGSAAGGTLECGEDRRFGV